MKLILEGTPTEIAAWQAEQAKRFGKDFLLDANQIARSTGGPGGQGNYYWRGGAGGCGVLTGTVGCAGAEGMLGPNGITGNIGYQLAVDSGFEGTESEWILRLNGEPGLKGDPGAQGQRRDSESDFIVKQLGKFAHNFGTRHGDPKGPRGRSCWALSSNPPSKIDAAIFELLSEKEIKDSDGNTWVPVERSILDEVIVLLCELNRIKTFKS